MIRRIMLIFTFFFILTFVSGPFFSPVFTYAEDSDCQAFTARIEKIYELKKAKYIDHINYDEKIKASVSRVLDKNRHSIIEKIVKKREILEKVKRIRGKEISGIDIKAIVNELFIVEKDIIQLQQDQFNELILIIDPQDAFLYIEMDRRFDHELRRRLRDIDRKDRR